MRDVRQGVAVPRIAYGAGPMIDASRWTANEREVVLAALLRYRESQRSRKSRTSSAVVSSDAQWRLVIVSQALDAIGGP